MPIVFDGDLGDLAEHFAQGVRPVLVPLAANVAEAIGLERVEDRHRDLLAEKPIADKILVCPGDSLAIKISIDGERARDLGQRPQDQARPIRPGSDMEAFGDINTDEGRLG